MGVGDSLARWVFNNQPEKFAAIELVPQTASDVPETLFGHLNADGTVTGGIADPRAGVVAVGPEPTGTSTVVEGLDTRPADDQPTIAEVNIVHLAWDVMVGLGTLLFLLSAVVRRCAGCSGGDMPEEQVVPARSPSCAGVAAVRLPWRRAGW